MYKKVISTTEEYYDDVPYNGSVSNSNSNSSHTPTIHIYPDAFLGLLNWMRDSNNDASNTAMITDNITNMSANYYVVTVEDLSKAVANTFPTM
jgi:hypothetical protein